ncbi:hypothetical protein SLA2020_075920 [Shorea laevis]
MIEESGDLSILGRCPKVMKGFTPKLIRPFLMFLNDLWENGLETYDASVDQSFKMRAALLWMISDHPGCSYLFGYSAKGKYGWPSCGFNFESSWLVYSKKCCYMSHRQWLETNHDYS